jgi:hypothetical protein
MNDDVRQNYPLTDREHATVLAALRYWQREGLMSGGHEINIATGGDENYFDELSKKEIDALCERLNLEGHADDSDLIAALHYLLEQTVDMDLKHGIGLTDGETEAREKALAAIAGARREN